MTNRNLVAVVCVTLALFHPCHAENIYPDPGFEKTGVVGDAHSGQRAGYLKSEKGQHWICIGGSLPVEPFAAYRATAWVKATAGTGARFALYCYAWNSFDWAFASNVPLRETDGWVEVETTFVSPHDYMMVHPLACIDSDKGEAWIDDIVVEKIKDAEETMKPLIEKQDPSMGDLQMLARYYASRGEPQKAKTLMEKADNYTRADIACLLAKQTKDPELRRSYIADMVHYGGLNYANGVTRFEEITADLTPFQRLAVCERVVASDPTSKGAATAYRQVAQSFLAMTAGAFTCAEVEERLSETLASVSRMLAAVPENSPSREEVETVRKSVDTARAAAQQRRASLGRCVINIGGRTLKAATHVIAIPSEPTPQEQHAAKDLQCHLELLTGQVFRILKDDQVTDQVPIVVGRSALLKKLGVRVNLTSLGRDGIVIKTVGPALILTGNQRGVLYACYTFLENFLHCRWYAPDCTAHPQKGTFDLGEIDVRYAPPLEYREPFAFVGYDADWAVRNKSNGSATRLDTERGGKVVYQGFVHTSYALVPPEKYFAKHPEYYAEVNGQRGYEYAQLCFSNPELVDVVVEAVRRWLKENPEANIVSVSQNDCGGNCQCPQCKAIDEAEGSPSGSLLRFVNQVAERIEKEFPNVAIDTLAYQYTRKPPKITKPRPNVIVRLCSIECSFSQPLGASPQNVAFRKDIEGWGKICKRLYVWDYVTDFAHYIQPHPNLHVLQPNIQFFVKNGVKGIFEQGGYQSPGGEMEELRTWLLAKLLWNPKSDVKALMKDFLEGYYGAAAPHLQRYIDLMRDSVLKSNTYLSCYSPPDAPFLTPEVITEADAIFDKAEKAVSGDATILKRVQTARLPLLYLHIVRDKFNFKEEGNALVATRSDKSAFVDRFAKIARAAGVTHIREGNDNLDDWISQTSKQTATVRIERLRNSTLDVAILPELGGRVWRLKYLPTGKDLFLRVGEEDSLQPGEGGYEEYSESGYRSPGWNEDYVVRERSDRGVLLQADLKNGLRLTRRIEIDPQAARVHITSTLTNPGSTPLAACLRVHPDFAVANTQRATAWTKSKDGVWQKHSLANPADPMAEKELWFRAADRPAGEWAVVDDTDGIGLISRFTAEQVSVCYLNWSGKDHRVNLELWSPNTTLKPGESLTIDHTYEVVKPAAQALR